LLAFSDITEPKSGAVGMFLSLHPAAKIRRNVGRGPGFVVKGNRPDPGHPIVSLKRIFSREAFARSCVTAPAPF